jgi:Tetracyclin repressor-like, C-terminal domain
LSIVATCAPALDRTQPSALRRVHQPRARPARPGPAGHYIFGFAHRETAWERLRERAGLTGEQWQERLDSYLEQARATDPELAALIQSRLYLTSQANFELGLDCVLDGIASRIVARSAGG